MRTESGSVIKQTEISELLGIGSPRAVCMASTLHGFESCGLCVGNNGRKKHW